MNIIVDLLHVYFFTEFWKRNKSVPNDKLCLYHHSHHILVYVEQVYILITFHSCLDKTEIH